MYPEFKLRLCFFHLCQSVQKNIFKRFKKQYKADRKFARASRLVVFLAFVPIDFIDDAFEALSYYIAGRFPALMSVVNYFEKVYLGALKVDGEREGAKYDVHYWNHYANCLLDPDFPRTSSRY